MKNTLTRERVARAGICIADAEGLDAVSMRRVARMLELSTMSSYRHVADRDDLLVAMVDTITRETTLPDHPGASWQSVLRAMALGDWHAFVQHPWLIAVWSTPRRRVDQASVAQLEAVLHHLELGGIDGAAGYEVVLGVAGLTLGIAALTVDDPGAELKSGLTLTEWRRQTAADLTAANASRPLASRFVTGLGERNKDELFTNALDAFIAGVEARHQAG